MSPTGEPIPYSPVPRCDPFQALNESLNVRLTCEALLAAVKEAFPPVHATPESTHAELIYAGAQQNVIRWIETRIDFEKQRR